MSLVGPIRMPAGESALNMVVPFVWTVTTYDRFGGKVHWGPAQAPSETKRHRTLVKNHEDALDLEELLRLCAVEVSSNPEATPRGQQMDLSRDIEESMVSYGHMAGQAGTGTGKSLAYIVPAVRRALLDDERTVISTELISLQTQLKRDLARVRKVVRKEAGRDFEFAVVKGFSQYVCPDSALVAAEALFKQFPSRLDAKYQELWAAEEPQVRKDVYGDQERVSSDEAKKIVRLTKFRVLSQMIDDIRIANPDEDVVIENQKYPAEKIRELVRWSFDQTFNGDLGERTECKVGGQLKNTWQTVSTDTVECAGLKCPLFDMCPAQNSRRKAKAAQIVVTNHTTLGIQAANSAPIILSSPRLQTFRHLVVDEAHTLLNQVRNSAESSINKVSVINIVTSYKTVSGEEQNERTRIGNELAKRLDDGIASWLVGKTDASRQIRPQKHPFAGLLTEIKEWAEEIARNAPREEALGGASDSIRALKRMQNRIQTLTHSIDQSLDEVADTDRDSPGVRWVEPKKGSDKKEMEGRVTEKPTIAGSIMFSPTDVKPLIARNLFSTEDVSDEGQAVNRDARREARKAGLDHRPSRLPVSFTAVSATLHGNFHQDAGLSCDTRVDYGSPFDAAYKNACLYIPRLTESDFDALKLPGDPKKKLETKLHPYWAAGHMKPLIEGCPDHPALVLAASAYGGEIYVQHLREFFPDRDIFGQWDDGDPQVQADAWVKHPNAILVGSRRFMTGLDKRGHKLVVIDRVARNPSNIIDDARCQVLIDEGMEEFVASSKVYVSDAALLLEQAAGRLIRDENSGGVVAILDPRLMPQDDRFKSMVGHKEHREVYWGALRHFREGVSRRTRSMSTAVEFLQNMPKNDAGIRAA